MTPTIARAGRRVHTGRRLGQVIGRKPTGVTAGQWNTAGSVVLDYLVTDAATDRPEFALLFTDDTAGGAARVTRMTTAVCDAVGLPLIRIGSPTLTAAHHGDQIMGYVLDAREFGVDYRDIVGRLPDGRTGYVNDLSSVARAAAVDAYSAREVFDPIIRGIRVRWAGGPAEGWAWLQLREGGYVFERVRLAEHRTTCGVPADRLAEDLAGAAIGQRLKVRDSAEPDLVDHATIEAGLRDLSARRAELLDGFPYEHLLADQPAAR
ncbi:hypothetical protein DFJ67_6653 [Asanoa ferruginea]|uniref:Uncharacterized protein n=1 Tax=Asanoa ferruginea TaxID=53367 RepID=A0A3D9ZTW2_9ACTN|nr:hypothetical protein [Asanoa ferruginea]REG00598.1 hypothetical protein DFJ67_6653 [Asanoa ferruginea]GIF47763.1 hypothetical protein Afe04nite_23020 [Asanoa ferruginea]